MEIKKVPYVGNFARWDDTFSEPYIVLGRENPVSLENETWSWYIIEQVIFCNHLVQIFADPEKKLGWCVVLVWELHPNTVDRLVSVERLLISSYEGGGRIDFPSIVGA